MTILGFSNRLLRGRILVAAWCLPVGLSAQGFGWLGGIKAKEATLKRTLPASVNLNQKRIKVVAEAAASSQINQESLNIIRVKLITSIQKDNRFVVDDRNPETLLKFSVTNYYVEARTTPASKYSAACTFYTGKLEVAYQAVEVGTDAPLDSENLEYAITQEGPKKGGLSIPGLSRSSGGCGTRAKASENEARDELIDSIMAQMSQRAAPFEETLTVPVPGGKLEPLSALAATGRWAKLLEDAEKADPLPKPQDDAYRLYLIGLANEALAYQDAKDAAELEKSRRGDTSSEKAKAMLAQEDKDFKDAQDYLDKATKAYKDALQAKPGEKEFRSPDARMEEAVKLYATITRHKEEYDKAVAARGRGGPSDGTRVALPLVPVSNPTLNQVISMCQDHLPDIGQMIVDHPTELHFTAGLTLAEELRLKKECGPADSKAILDAVKSQLSHKVAAKQ